MAQSTKVRVHLGETALTWDILTERLLEFAAAWKDAAAPPQIADFAPAHPPELRRLVLAELVKVDLEQRWLHRQSPRTVEEYAADFPELAAGGIDWDLIHEEMHVRRRAGDDVTLDDYCRRFPEQAQQMEQSQAKLGATSTAYLHHASLQSIQPGQDLGEFNLLHLLGRGGFAKVFLAWQRSMHRLVALKVSADKGDEPRTLAQLDHPHIVRVFDQRSLPDRGLRLLYMEYLSGGNLQGVIAWLRDTPPADKSGASLLAYVDDVLQRRGDKAPADSQLRQRLALMSWPDAVCWLGSKLAAALDHAHRRGILHRDVKPANILLTADASPKLADFNIGFASKLEGASAAASFGGSFGYMSPEQLEAFHPGHPRRPDSLDGRGDLFSLGIVLWELLTGGRPFDEQGLGSGNAALDQLIARRRAGIPADLISDIPEPLWHVVTRCLDAEPERRYATGDELARELQLVLQPRAHALLRPHPAGWRRLVLAYPIVALMIVAIVPNLLIGAFNFFYNYEEIVRSLQVGQDAFWLVQGVINATAFPLGLAIGGCLAWPIGRTLGELRRGQTPAADRIAWCRRRCLRLGTIVAWISISEWVLAGFAYPISIHVLAGDLPASAFLHFLVALIFCGLLAAVYPFFAVTVLAVRVLYPVLVQPALGRRTDADDLPRLSRLSGIFSLLAAAIPMLAIALLVLAGSQNMLALMVLSAGGLLAFAAAFWATRTIQADLEALAAALGPAGRDGGH